jgi:hypothetical protein
MYDKFSPDDPDADKRLRAFFSPQQIDNQVRQAIQFCWMALPAEKKTIDEVETQIRRIVERALKDLREDAASFGLLSDE